MGELTEKEKRLDLAFKLAESAGDGTFVVMTLADYGDVDVVAVNGNETQRVVMSDGTRSCSDGYDGVADFEAKMKEWSEKYGELDISK